MNRELSASLGEATAADHFEDPEYDLPLPAPYDAVPESGEHIDLEDAP